MLNEKMKEAMKTEILKFGGIDFDERDGMANDSAMAAYDELREEGYEIEVLVDGTEISLTYNG